MTRENSNNPTNEQPDYFHRQVAEREARVGDQRLARVYLVLEEMPAVKGTDKYWLSALGESNPFRTCLVKEEFDPQSEYATSILSSPERFTIQTNVTPIHNGIPIGETLLALDLQKFGAMVSAAFVLRAKFADVGLRKTCQIAELGTMPIILTIPRDNQELWLVAAVLTAAQTKVNGPFVLLAPTRKYINYNIDKVLSRCGAKIFDLESYLRMSPDGLLRASQTGGELFSHVLPKQANKAEMGLIVLAHKMRTTKVWLKAHLWQVFNILVFEKQSKADAARICGCSPGLITARVKEIEDIMNTPIEQLQEMDWDALADMLSDGTDGSDNGGSGSDNGGSGSDNGGSGSDNGGSGSDNGGSGSDNGGSGSDNGGSDSDNGGSDSDNGGSDSDNGGSDSDGSDNRDSDSDDQSDF